MTASDEQMMRAWMPAIEVLNPADDMRRAKNVDKVIGNDGKLIRQRPFDATWNGNNPLMLGPYHFWVDGVGLLRKKNGKASSDTDGGIV